MVYIAPVIHNSNIPEWDYLLIFSMGFTIAFIIILVIDITVRYDFIALIVKIIFWILFIVSLFYIYNNL